MHGNILLNTGQQMEKNCKQTTSALTYCVLFLCCIWIDWIKQKKFPNFLDCFKRHILSYWQNELAIMMKQCPVTDHLACLGKSSFKVSHWKTICPDKLTVHLQEFLPYKINKNTCPQPWKLSDIFQYSYLFFSLRSVDSREVTVQTVLWLNCFHSLMFTYHRNNMSDTITTVYNCASQCSFSYLSWRPRCS